MKRIVALLGLLTLGSLLVGCGSKEPAGDAPKGGEASATEKANATRKDGPSLTNPVKPEGEGGKSK